MREFKAEVTRDGRWWMISFPELEGVTQARRISEIAQMAREYAAITTDTPISEVKVDIASITVPEVGDVAHRATEIKSTRRHALHIEAQAAAQTVEYAKAMAAAGIPVRDIGELLELSPQRVSQITSPEGARK